MTLRGYHRKSAIRLLNRGVNNALTGRKPQRRGPKARYQDPEFRRTLRLLWSEMERQCGRNMKEAIPRWLPDFEDEHGALRADIRERLISVSHSTIDRILKEFRTQEKWKGGIRRGALKDQIQISTHAIRDDRPGHMSP